MKEWLFWTFGKNSMVNILDKLQALTHPGVTYAAYAYGVAHLLYAVGGYMLGAVPLDQAMEHLKQGVEVAFFTTVSSPLVRK